MEFKRFKRKGIVFKNNSIGLGLEVTIKKNKVFQVERLTKNYNDFEYLIYNGPRKDGGNSSFSNFLFN